MSFAHMLLLVQAWYYLPQPQLSELMSTWVSQKTYFLSHKVTCREIFQDSGKHVS